jgi:hypothetical protein
LEDEIILPFQLFSPSLLLCGNANIWELVTFRFIQGLEVALY